jgi:hypothetical protein
MKSQLANHVAAEHLSMRLSHLSKLLLHLNLRYSFTEEIHEMLRHGEKVAEDAKYDLIVAFKLQGSRQIGKPKLVLVAAEN